jgi:hypothetical protein
MAITALIRSRRRLLGRVGLVVPVLPARAGQKVVLWSVLASVLAGRTALLTGAQQRQLHQALQSTEAYRNAQRRLSYSGCSPFRRGLDYSELLRQCRDLQPERVVLFHHYDRRGCLPESWLRLLLAMRASGWVVLVSSSHLQPAPERRLRDAGSLIALRQNIGLCLGAYRDLALLLQMDPVVSVRLRSLVLCNDSTLPVASESALIGQLERWAADTEAGHHPVLAGLTDSAQRGAYHLQSFLLHANSALLQHPAWLRFWLGFSLVGSKDDLINRGEVGLSQALLAAGVELRPAYPLVQGLLEDPAMADELQRFSISQPKHVNQSLFAWQSLLARGFPLVKKHVLFDLLENQGQPMALASLARWIPAERRELLAADLQELFVSRYAFITPEAE